MKQIICSYVQSKIYVQSLLWLQIYYFEGCKKSCESCGCCFQGWNVVTKGLRGIENKPKLIALISQLGCRNLVIKGEIHFVNYLIKDVC